MAIVPFGMKKSTALNRPSLQRALLSIGADRAVTRIYLQRQPLQYQYLQFFIRAMTGPSRASSAANKTRLDGNNERLLSLVSFNVIAIRRKSVAATKQAAPGAAGRMQQSTVNRLKKNIGRQTGQGPGRAPAVARRHWPWRIERRQLPKAPAMAPAIRRIAGAGRRMYQRKD